VRVFPFYGHSNKIGTAAAAAAAAEEVEPGEVAATGGS